MTRLIVRIVVGFALVLATVAEAKDTWITYAELKSKVAEASAPDLTTIERQKRVAELNSSDFAIRCNGEIADVVPDTIEMRVRKYRYVSGDDRVPTLSSHWATVEVPTVRVEVYGSELPNSSRRVFKIPMREKDRASKWQKGDRLEWTERARVTEHGAIATKAVFRGLADLKRSPRPADWKPLTADPRPTEPPPEIAAPEDEVAALDLNQSGMDDGSMLVVVHRSSVDAVEVVDHWYRLDSGNRMENPYHPESEAFETKIITGPAVVRVRSDTRGNIVACDVYPADHAIPKR